MKLTTAAQDLEEGLDDLRHPFRQLKGWRKPDLWPATEARAAILERRARFTSHLQLQPLEA